MYWCSIRPQRVPIWVSCWNYAALPLISLTAFASASRIQIWEPWNLQPVCPRVSNNFTIGSGRAASGAEDQTTAKFVWSWNARLLKCHVGGTAAETDIGDDGRDAQRCLAEYILTPCRYTAGAICVLRDNRKEQWLEQS
jgi:hypothetical protein